MNIDFTPGMMDLLCKLRIENIRENPNDFFDMIRQRLEHVPKFWAYTNIDVFVEDGFVHEIVEYLAEGEGDSSSYNDRCKITIVGSGSYLFTKKTI